MIVFSPKLTSARFSYVNGVATTYSGNYIDHNIRVNSVFTNYRISGGAWSQRLGDFAGPIFPDKDSLTFSLIAANSTKVEIVIVSWFSDPSTRLSVYSQPYVASSSIVQPTSVPLSPMVPRTGKLTALRLKRQTASTTADRRPH